MKKDIIFDATYTSDQKNRRISYPADRPPKNKKKHLMIHGGSFSYGIGIKDEQTLGWKMATLAENYHVYNYAIPGSAPHMAIADLKARKLKEEVTQSEGHFIYLFLDFHINRVNGFMQELQWLAHTPVYEEKDGRMINVGTFKSAQPIRTAIMYFLHNVIKVHERFRMNYPKLRDHHIEYTCHIFKELKNTYLDNFKQGKFTIVMHPLTFMRPELSKCLRENNIDLFIPNLKNYPHEDKLRIPLDLHPNELLNDLLSKEIYTTLLK